MRRPRSEALSLVLRTAGVFALAASLVLNAAAVLLLLDSSNKARQQRAAQLRLASLLVECTTPPELREPPVDKPGPKDCYVRQTSQQAKILGEPSGPINTVAVAAAACGSAHPGDYAATLRCTRRAIAAR